MPSQTSERLSLPDVNVLVALVHDQHIGHLAALEWFDAVVRYATTPVTEAGLLRLALNPSVMKRQISLEAALSSLRSLRDDPRATFVTDDTTLTAARIDLIGLRGHRQVSDFHLVDLAARHEAVLVTLDRGIPLALRRDDRQFVEVIG